MNIPVTFDNLKDAYDALRDAIDDAFVAQKRLNELEAEKADKWADLTSNPDFKPGRSNLEQAAKLRAAFPAFMSTYETVVEISEGSRHNVELARVEVNKLAAMLRLGQILVAVKDDLEDITQ